MASSRKADPTGANAGVNPPAPQGAGSTGGFAPILAILNALRASAPAAFPQAPGLLPSRFSPAGPTGTGPGATTPAAGTGAPPGPAQAKIEFVSPAPDTVFFIDTTPIMPRVDVEVRVTGITPDPTPQTTFSWTVEVKFDETEVCTFGKRGVVFTDSFTAPGIVGGRFTPSFPWIRGGRLALTATATVNGNQLSGQLKLWIFGTDPGWQAVSAELGDDTLRKIAKFESGGIQFENDSGKSHQGVPKLNQGHDGGGGIGQITPPSADDLWNWKANVASAKRKFAQNQGTARQFPQKVATSPEFTRLVEVLNAKRAAAGARTLNVRVPPFNADQLRKDAIRGYNGFAGGMHEFRLSVVNGELQITNVNEQAGTADAVWERVPPQDRPSSGDPNYVDHVLNTPL